MKAVIIGADGQLGADLMKGFADVSPVGLTREQIEICSPDSILNALSDLHPDVVVNTAAFHNVPVCEKEITQSFDINAVGPLNLAKASESLGFELVHISTDYVFDGKKQAPYVETDPPNPLSVYAVSKLAGEHFVSSYCSKHYIVRTSGLYGHTKCMAKGTNFVETMLRLAKEKPELRVVNDEILTPTYVYHLALQIRKLVDSHVYGMYHATNNGSCSWYEFAKEIFKIAGVTIPVVPVTSKEFASPVKRPTYSVLENAALQKLGIDIMPPWRDSLAHYFQNK